MIITGAGRRYNAGVDSTNRLLTRSVARSDNVDAGLRDEAFFLITPVIELTSANPSLLWLFQNDEDRDLIVTSAAIASGPSTGGTTDSFEVNRIAGVDLVATGGAGVPMPVASKIVGSNRTLANTSELGQEGASLTTGTLDSPQFARTGETTDNGIFLILPKGTQFGEVVTPPAGNTSMRVTVLLECYLREAL